MKILAIRGYNLASLAGEFEIDFESEPLASTGLFAICGPTGAGKSTLLDALCVALFNETPRLKGAEGAKIRDGDQELSVRDSRNLLRRSSVEGFAEVDFTGHDGTAYRANWKVRRARGRPEGRIGDPVMTLHRLPDLVPAATGTRTEVLKAIQEKLGLSFEQFTRSVLLAQNEFATFLKSKDDERASLLQILTGTKEFTTISTLVHRRHGEENNRVKALEESRKAFVVLDPEARAALEAELNKQAEIVKSGEAAIQQLAAQLQWYGEWEKAEAETIKASDSLKKAELEHQEAEERRQRLQRVESVQPARSLLADFERLEKESGKVETERHKAEGDHKARTQEVQAADEELNKAAQAVKQAEENRKTQLPNLKLARELDGDVKAQSGRLNDLNKQLSARKTALQTGEKENAEKAIKLKEVRLALEKAEAWFAERSAHKALAEKWERWDTLFASAAGFREELLTVKEDIATNEKQHLTTSANAEKAEADLKNCVLEIDKAKALLAEAQKVLSGFNISELAQRRKKTLDRQNALLGIEKHWEAVLQERSLYAELSQEAKALQQQRDASRNTLKEAEQKIPIARENADRAQRDFDVAQMMAGKDVEALRKELRRGEACFVCGSTEHPYTEVGTQATSRLDEFRKLRDIAHEALNGLLKTQSTQGELIRRHEESLKLLEEKREKTGKRVSTAESDLAGSSLFNELSRIVEEDRKAWLDGERTATQAEAAVIEQEEAKANEARTTCDEAQKSVDGITRRQLGLQKIHDAAAKALGDLAHRLKALQGQRDSLSGNLEQVLIQLHGAELSAIDPEWREKWNENPASFSAARRKEAEQWLEAIQRREDRLNQEKTLLVEVTQLQKRGEELKEEFSKAKEAFDQAEQVLSELTLKRRKVFIETKWAELSTDEVERLLDDAVEQSRKQHEIARGEAEKARVELQKTSTQINLLSERLAGLKQQFADAKNSLDGWLANHQVEGQPSTPLSIDELRTLLAFADDWIKEERSLLARLAEEVKTCTRLLEQQQKTMSEVETRRPTPEPKEEVARQHAEQSQQLDSERKKEKELDFLLKKDNDKRAQDAEKRKEIEEMSRTVELWATLNDLVGSYDGSKFRNYAQELTLDILVEYANRHLHDLARRYKLKRNANLSLIIIDQDMADEERSVHSLSGGESFLVSLALALGLASLSSHRIRVDSLFIDEGFGSLDPDTLQIAMDALDTLQDQGRKVGVISHVREMTERIGVRIDVEKQAGGKSRVRVADTLGYAAPLLAN